MRTPKIRDRIEKEMEDLRRSGRIPQTVDLRPYISQ